MREIMTKQKKETSMKRNNLIKKFFLYLILLIITRLSGCCPLPLRQTVKYSR